MHDAYIGGLSENNIKCVVVHNDLGRKNRTIRYNCRFSAASLALRVTFSVSLVVEHIRFFHRALQFSSACSVKLLCFITLKLHCDAVAISKMPKVKLSYTGL